MSQQTIRLLVQDVSYPDELPPFASPDDVIAAAAEEVEPLGEVRETKQVNIGHGADFPFIEVVVIVTSGALTLFFSGKRIEENLDAWKRLAERFVTTIRNVKRRLRSVYMDPEGVILVSLNKVLDTHPDAKTIEIHDRFEIVLDENSWNDSDSLAAKPYVLHIITITIGDDQMMVMGVRSTGHIDFVRHYRRMFGFFDWVPAEEADRADTGTNGGHLQDEPDIDGPN